MGVTAARRAVRRAFSNRTARKGKIMWPDHRIGKLLSIETPIIQAPMAGANSLDMALAVSAAGGMGSIACAPLDTGALRDMLRAAREQTDKPININFFTHTAPSDSEERDRNWIESLSGYYRELDLETPQSLSTGSIQPFDSARCSIIEEFAPPVVSFHFGLPDPELVARIKAVGSKIISSATTVEEARWLADHGCDAIVAQGYEAGGHRGMFLVDDINTQIGTISLVPQVVDAVDVPVIAAGGIADGRGIAAAMALGASGVQLGTAFLFTREATINTVYRHSLDAAADHGTALSNVFSGRPTRVLVNRMMQELGPVSSHSPVFPKGFSAMSPLRIAAEKQGSRDFSAQYSGQSAPLGKKSSAYVLTKDLASDALRRLNQWSTY